MPKAVLMMVMIIALAKCKPVRAEPEFTCIRGIMWVRTGSAIAWVPTIDGKPETCVEEVTVPEDAK